MCRLICISYNVTVVYGNAEVTCIFLRKIIPLQYCNSMPVSQGHYLAVVEFIVCFPGSLNCSNAAYCLFVRFTA